MNIVRRRLLVSSALALACPFCLRAEDDNGCLYSLTTEDAGSVGCSSDPLKIAQRSETAAFYSAFKLSSNISFIGCNKTAFKTVVGESSGALFKIFYPGDATAYSAADYAAPIGHELAHVFQVKNSGSLKNLQKRSSLCIELGADFLCGLVYKNYLHGNASDFEDNMSLIGRYRELSNSAHGNPDQRAQAFRRGYFLRFEDFNNNITAANNYFLSDIFGQIQLNG
ncbi:hypothetical protein AB4Y42_35055 [Paraburkholderia sp. EG286B]|uniref:hypothetical protein n=1 Tax=Paraburkholderia sp. EG286B TaxID=3237011 RepID=UPI0034D1B3EE